MNRKIIVTGDNSKSLLIPEWNETYHSIHGAKNESLHVFIKNGLERMAQTCNSINLLEVGFGTGLNALLSLDFANGTPIYIAYDSIEKFPLDIDTIKALNHPENTGLIEHSLIFNKMHQSPWNEKLELSPNFSLNKISADLVNFKLKQNYYSLIYFDAFAPKIQPELWQKPILKKMFDALRKDGLLVTYCAQGQFKRDLIQVGFTIECVPGPKGKREMTCAFKS